MGKKKRRGNKQKTKDRAADSTKNGGGFLFPNHAGRRLTPLASCWFRSSPLLHEDLESIPAVVNGNTDYRLSGIGNSG